MNQSHVSIARQVGGTTQEHKMSKSKQVRARNEKEFQVGAGDNHGSQTQVTKEVSRINTDNQSGATINYRFGTVFAQNKYVFHQIWRSIEFWMSLYLLRLYFKLVSDVLYQSYHPLHIACKVQSTYMCTEHVILQFRYSIHSVRRTQSSRWTDNGQIVYGTLLCNTERCNMYDTLMLCNCVCWDLEVLKWP